MRRLSDIDRAIRAYRRRVMTGEMRAVSSAVRAFDHAERRVRKLRSLLLKEMARRERAGDPITETQLLTLDRYQALQTGLSAAATEVSAAATGVAVAKEVVIQHGAALGARATYAAAGARSLKARAALGIEFDQAPISRLVAAVGAAQDGSPLSDLFVAMGTDRGAAVRQILLEGIGASESSQAIAKRLEAEASVSRARAASIARTEVHRAARAATQARYQQASSLLSGWVWVSSRNSRTCPACWAMDGTEHELGEPMGSHVSCRCAQAPLLRDARTSPTQPDVRPRYGTGAERFDRLSEADQRAVLGPGRYELFAAGKLAITPEGIVRQTTDPRWGVSRTPKPLKELL